MTALMQKRRSAFVVLLALCMILVIPATALAESTAEYTKESKQEFEQQLAKGEIEKAVFNKKLRRLHITTKNGHLYLYHYEKKGSDALKKELATKHISVTVLTPSQAAKEKPGTKKHKIRYIVGAVVIVLIVIGLVIFFVRRRGMRD
jgi:ATP-dependent Zn protease